MRYLNGVPLIGLPCADFGLVAYSPIKARNSPLSTNDPSFKDWICVCNYRCNNSSSAVQDVLVSDALGVLHGWTAGGVVFGWCRCVMMSSTPMY